VRVLPQGVDRVLWVIQLVPDSPPSLQSADPSSQMEGVMEGVSPVFHPSSDSTIPSSKATTPQLRTPEDTGRGSGSCGRGTEVLCCIGVDQTPLRIPKRQPTLSELPPPAQRYHRGSQLVPWLA
jgi:hypothetical protein